MAIGRSGASIGVATYVKEPYWPLNTCLFVTDFKGNDPRWVYWMLKGIDFVGFNSGSAQPSLNRNYLAGIPVYVPPRDVQAAIAEVLGALDDKIAANERLSGAVQDLLQERFALLRLDGFTGDGSFLTVSDLFDVNPRTSQKLAGQAPYLGMKDLPDSSMTVGSWSTREAKSGARFINGDVLLARITPCLENGKAGYVDFLENTEVGVGSTEFIVFRARSPLLSAVPFFLTKSERFRDFAIKHMQGTSGRQRLAAADVADYRLAKVDDESLNRFGELSLSLLKRVKTAVSESRALARTRDELLPLLMNGKITVKDAEAVVSDAV
ncbi:type I restriction enzyme, S subunit [Brevibacterium linens ATCC 9172]|uniref:Type I restriction enzyme, S subunit n=1 Tax=Brevibacterium linens ATCC 9172 TaxID=1255617 RepID=A0A2H1J657_BRELN|nr:type I restriction enzyme, S subunit [Brevibacterium linens ATCC 9172]